MEIFHKYNFCTQAPLTSHSELTIALVWQKKGVNEGENSFQAWRAPANTLYCLQVHCNLTKQPACPSGEGKQEQSRCCSRARCRSGPAEARSTQRKRNVGCLKCKGRVKICILGSHISGTDSTQGSLKLPPSIWPPLKEAKVCNLDSIWRLTNQKQRLPFTLFN